MARIRNALAAATHAFFQQEGFLYVHTPIITCSDCEGAGEMFQVTAPAGGHSGHAPHSCPGGDLLFQCARQEATKLSTISSVPVPLADRESRCQKYGYVLRRAHGSLVALERPSCVPCIADPLVHRFGWRLCGGPCPGTGALSGWCRRQVTTLMSSIDEVQKQPQLTEADLAALREKSAAQGEAVKAAKAVRPAPALPCFQELEAPAGFASQTVYVNTPRI